MLAIQPLPGEGRGLWGVFHEIQDVIDTQARDRFNLVTLIGKLDREQEEVERGLEGLLNGPVTREAIEEVLKHHRNSRQYTARLGKGFKDAEKNAISLRSMTRLFGMSLKRVGL